jgi:hypothetical protein
MIVYPNTNKSSESYRLGIVVITALILHSTHFWLIFVIAITVLSTSSMLEYHFLRNDEVVKIEKQCIR